MHVHTQMLILPSDSSHTKRKTTYGFPHQSLPSYPYPRQLANVKRWIPDRGLSGIQRLQRRISSTMCAAGSFRTHNAKAHPKEALYAELADNSSFLQQKVPFRRALREPLRATMRMSSTFPQKERLAQHSEPLRIAHNLERLRRIPTEGTHGDGHRRSTDQRCHHGLIPSSQKQSGS